MYLHQIERLTDERGRLIGGGRRKAAGDGTRGPTPGPGGSWRKTKSGRFPYELLIVYNGPAPQIPVEAELKLLTQPS